MTTDGSTTMGLLDQRLDALDRALLGLVPRSERISMVAEIETRLREKGECDFGGLEVEESVSEVGARSTTMAARPAGRKRSRMALTAGILGIVSVGLLMLLPVTYFVIAMTAEVIGEIPAISVIVINVLSVAGLGLLGGVLSLVAIVRVSRSKKRMRGLGWAITGLCTSPLPALAGLLAMVFFVLPITVEYARQPTQSADVQVVSGPGQIPPPFPPPPAFDCSNGTCVPPPSLNGGSYASPYGSPYASPDVSPMAPPAVNVPYAPPTDVALSSAAPINAPPISAPPINAPPSGDRMASKPVSVSEVKKAESAEATGEKKEGVTPQGGGEEPKLETSGAPMFLPPAESAESLP